MRVSRSEEGGYIAYGIRACYLSAQNVNADEP